MLLRKTSVFALALVAGAATAGPVTGALNGVSGLLAPAAGAGAAPAGVRLPALPLASLPATGKAFGKTPAGTLPGLGAAMNSTEGPLGATVLQEGADGSGYDYVLNSEQLQPLYMLNPLTNDVVSSTVLNGLTTALLQEELVTNGTLLDDDHLVDDGVDNNLVTPLLGLDGDGGMLDVAVFDGNGTANAGNIGAAVGSGSATGNGGDIGIGVANDGFSGNGGALGVGVANQGPVSGNGGQIGIGVLSGEASGNGGMLGVGLLNTNDPLHVCAGGTCGGLNDLIDAAGPDPLIDSTGVVLGGGKSAQTSGASNPLLNAGVLTGDNVGNGGLIGIGVLAGDNSANASLLGACVLCGDNVANGASLGVAALSGNNAGNGSYDTGLLPVGLGAAALAGNNSGNGGDLGVAALAGNNSGNADILGAGALSGANSGNGGDLGIGVGAVNSGGNAGSSGGGSGSGSGGGGLIGVGAISDSGSGGGGGGGGNNGGNNPGGNNQTVAEAGDEGFCALEVRDGKGRVVQTLKRPCKQLAKAKRKA